jgi:hypothetical protein
MRSVLNIDAGSQKSPSRMQQADRDTRTGLKCARLEAEPFEKITSMNRHRKSLVSKTCFTLCFCLMPALLPSCASTSVDSHKTPGADLWMYHTYSWRPEDPSSPHAESEKRVKTRTDLNLTDRGMIRVAPSGNPDFWINERVTPQAIELLFIDAHSGSQIWSGRSIIKTEKEPVEENTVNSSVDTLVNRYIAAQEWMPASFWWKGIDLVGS